MVKERTVAVLRSKAQAEETSRLIREYGWSPYLLPVIETRRTADDETIRRIARRLSRGEFDYIIFTSVNCVRLLFEEAERLNVFSELKEGFRKVQAVAIGPSTRSELQAVGLTTLAMPQEYSSEGIVEHLRRLDMKGRRILIPRVDISSDTLTEGLKALGSHVEVIPVYEVALPEGTDAYPRFIEDLKGGRVDAILFTSPSTVVNLFTLLGVWMAEGEVRDLLNRRTTVVAIGPVTARRLTEYRVEVDVHPEVYTIRAMLDALSEYWAETSVSDGQVNP